MDSRQSSRRAWVGDELGQNYVMGWFDGDNILAITRMGMLGDDSTATQGSASAVPSSKKSWRFYPVASARSVRALFGIALSWAFGS